MITLLLELRKLKPRERSSFLLSSFKQAIESFSDDAVKFALKRQTHKGKVFLF